MPINNKNIIDRIGYFRTQKNLSARELSLRIGKHDTYINKLESNDFNLPVSVLLGIIEVLGVSCEEFFFDNFTTYKQDKELLCLFKSLTPQKKEAIIALIKQ